MIGEKLYLYLATSPEALSSVLVRVGDGGAQKPIYYISRVLNDTEIRYSNLEKIIYSLIISAKHLRPYFQAHPIMVLIDQPLKAILSRPDTSGRMAKWAIKLNEFDISYQPRTVLKSQVLANFLVECTWPTEDNEGLSSESYSDPVWILHVDGASNSSRSGTGLIITNSDGFVAEYALRF